MTYLSYDVGVTRRATDHPKGPVRHALHPFATKTSSGGQVARCGATVVRSKPVIAFDPSHPRSCSRCVWTAEGAR